MTRTWDVIIVGGGLMGCAAACYAARAGLSVLLFERDAPGSAQSGRNLGFVRQQGRDFREVPLAMGAAEIWRGLEADLGRPLGWVQSGYVALAMSEDEVARQQAWCDDARQYGLDTQILTAREVQARLPDLAPGAGVAGAMFTASDGKAEPAAVTRAYFEVACASGAQAISGRRVTRIETAGGRVVGVRAGGQSYRARAVICAAGAASAGLLRPLGLHLPQEVIRATVAQTAPLASTFAHCVSCPMTGMRQRADGAMLLSVAGGEYDVRLDSWRHAGWYRQARRDNPDASRLNVLSPLRGMLARGTPPPPPEIVPTSDNVPPERRRIRQAHDEFARFFPALAGTKVTASWAGYIDTLPDMVPALGEVGDIPGLIVATGFSGHGFGLGPMVGRVLSDLLQGVPLAVDLGPLAPARFASPAAAPAQNASAAVVPAEARPAADPPHG